MIIKAGVTYSSEDNTFTFNFSEDSKEDVIHLVNLSLKQSSIFEHVYFYGYDFVEGLYV
jgi:hypothetical protein